MINKLLCIPAILTTICCHSQSLTVNIQTNYSINLSESPMYMSYEFVAPFDKQLQIDCAFEETSDCKSNFISVGIEGNNRDMVEYCDGNFTETSAFRRMTVLIALRQPFTCNVETINRTREVCGASISRKISDGVKASPNEFPYYAAVYSVQIQLVNCGGTLINHNSVVTAAHCFTSDDQKEYIDDTWIYLGLSSFLDFAENPYLQIVKPKRVTRHSNYNWNKLLGDDIAIVTLERSVEYSFGVGPVCLPDKTTLNEFSKATLVILGFGQISETGQSSQVLLKAHVIGYSDKQCNSYFQKGKNMDKVLSKNKFCVITDKSNNMDTCPGDSGGPVIYKSNKDYLVGVVSAGLDCGVKIPSLNTKISSYKKWIDENSKD